jgi:hypothetical protein
VTRFLCTLKNLDPNTWWHLNRRNKFNENSTIRFFMHLEMTHTIYLSSWNIISLYNVNPRHKHYSIVKRIQHNVKGSSNQGLKLQANEKSYEKSWDYWVLWFVLSSDIYERKSKSECVFKLTNVVTIWTSFEQNFIDQLIVETKNMTTSEFTKEALWSKDLFKEMVLS